MSGFFWLVGGAAIAALVAVVVWHRDKQRRGQRLRQLADYLAAASCGRETVLARTEDEFSMLEDELYKTVGELRSAKEQAQRERQQQADNLADIAHQIKTPLTSMSLMTQLLADGADAQQQDCLGRIDNQLSRLGRLTSALLTMSRLDAKAIVFVRGKPTFEELAAWAAEPLEQVMRIRSQTLTVTGQRHTVPCDATWTTEALVNLLKNCSEHTPPGGELRLDCAVTPLYTQIMVEDSGSGFAPEDIPKLFRRFYRGSNSGKDSIGIGLALCRSIIEGQSGVIRAENRQEGGARFVIRFYL